MKISLFLVFFLCLTEVGAHGRRQHGSHQHGTGKLSIAFDGAIGKMDFKIPSESIFGFEHEAKTAKQKAAKKAGIDALERKISSLVVFDPTLQCVITADKVEVVTQKRSSHSDTVAAYSLKCLKSPIGTAITFNFQKEFPKIKDLDIAVVADSLQKSIEAKEAGTRLELK